MYVTGISFFTLIVLELGEIHFQLIHRRAKTGPATDGPDDEMEPDGTSTFGYNGSYSEDILDKSNLQMKSKVSGYRNLQA